MTTQPVHSIIEDITFPRSRLHLIWRKINKSKLFGCNPLIILNELLYQDGVHSSENDSEGPQKSWILERNSFAGYGCCSVFGTLPTVTVRDRISIACRDGLFYQKHLGRTNGDGQYREGSFPV